MELHVLELVGVGFAEVCHHPEAKFLADSDSPHQVLADSQEKPFLERLMFLPVEEGNHPDEQLLCQSRPQVAASLVLPVDQVVGNGVSVLEALLGNLLRGVVEHLHEVVENFDEGLDNCQVLSLELAVGEHPLVARRTNPRLEETLTKTVALNPVRPHYLLQRLVGSVPPPEHSPDLLEFRLREQSIPDHLSTPHPWIVLQASQQNRSRFWRLLGKQEGSHQEKVRLLGEFLGFENALQGCLIGKG